MTSDTTYLRHFAFTRFPFAANRHCSPSAPTTKRSRACTRLLTGD